MYDDIKNINNMKNMSRIFAWWLCMCILAGCQERKSHSVLELFSQSSSLSVNEAWSINEDSIAVIEGLVCDGENLVVYDLHSSKSYTLFDAKTGSYITHFGIIGQGPCEISVGCYGYLLEKHWSVFDNQKKNIIKYSMDSLRNNKVNGSPVCLAKYDIPDMDISRLIVVDDSTFVGSGTYKSKYQYFVFDKHSEMLGYGVDVYNAANSQFDVYTRFLANQGDLVVNPNKKNFASSVNFSSNIDFFEIKHGDIELKKSLRLGDPLNQPFVGEGGAIFSVHLTEKTQNGYINLCGTSQYVYALYSDKKYFETGRKSNTVLVFDWDGNPVRKYDLDTDAYYIAVSETLNCLFAAVKNEEKGWKVICYTI